MACACAGPARVATTTKPVDVTGLSFPGLDDRQLSLASLRGKVVVLHLFTTWSVASQVDVQQVQALHDRALADVAVVGVALDPDGKDLVGPWTRGMATRYRVVLSTPLLRSGKSVLGRIVRVPTTLVVDRHGRTRNRVERQLKPQELARLVEAARRAR